MPQITDKGITPILVNGEYVGVTAKGSGRPVILLHGYMSDRQSFYYQIQAIAERGRTAVACDMPSFGASAPISRPWSVGDYADWLAAFIEKGNLRGADIIAHSFGARVAFKLLSRDSGVAGKLVITGGAGLVKERSPAYIRQVKRYRRVKKLFPKYAERHFGSEEYRALPPVMKESYKLIVNEDLRECAAAVKNPALLIYGNNDTVTPPNEEGAIFSSLIAGSRLVCIDGGHFCFCENPTVFNGLVFEFLGI